MLSLLKLETKQGSKEFKIQHSRGGNDLFSTVRNVVLAKEMGLHMAASVNLKNTFELLECPLDDKLPQGVYAKDLQAKLKECVFFSLSSTAVIEGLSLLDVCKSGNLCEAQVEFLNDFGCLAINLHELKIAENIFTRVLKTKENVHDSVVILNNLGCSRGLQGQYNEAKICFSESEVLFEQLLKQEDEIMQQFAKKCLVSIYNNLGWLHTKLGAHAEAHKYCVRVCARATSDERMENHVLFAAQHNMVRLLLAQNHPKSAEKILRKHLSLCSDFGEKTLILLTELELLSLQLNVAHNSRQVEEIVDNIMEDFEAHEPFDGLIIGDVTILVLHRLVDLNVQLGRLRKALELVTKVVDLCKRVYGTQHPLMASALHHLACVCWERGDIPSCVIALREASKSLEDVYKSYHPRLASCYFKLSFIHSKKNDLNEAQKYFDCALKVVHNVFGCNASLIHVDELLGTKNIVAALLIKFGPAVEKHKRERPRHDPPSLEDFAVRCCKELGEEGVGKNHPCEKHSLRNGSQGTRSCAELLTDTRSHEEEYLRNRNEEGQGTKSCVAELLTDTRCREEQSLRNRTEEGQGTTCAELLTDTRCCDDVIKNNYMCFNENLKQWLPALLSVGTVLNVLQFGRLENDLKSLLFDQSRFGHFLAALLVQTIQSIVELDTQTSCGRSSSVEILSGLLLKLNTSAVSSVFSSEIALTPEEVDVPEKQRFAMAALSFLGHAFTKLNEQQKAFQAYSLLCDCMTMLQDESAGQWDAFHALSQEHQFYYSAEVVSLLEHELTVHTIITTTSELSENNDQERFADQHGVCKLTIHDDRSGCRVIVTGQVRGQVDIEYLREISQKCMEILGQSWVVDPSHECQRSCLIQLNRPICLGNVSLLLSELELLSLCLNAAPVCRDELDELVFRYCQSVWKLSPSACTPLQLMDRLLMTFIREEGKLAAFSDISHKKGQIVLTCHTPAPHRITIANVGQSVEVTSQVPVPACKQAFPSVLPQEHVSTEQTGEPIPVLDSVSGTPQCRCASIHDFINHVINLCSGGGDVKVLQVSESCAVSGGLEEAGESEAESHSSVGVQLVTSERADREETLLKERCLLRQCLKHCHLELATLQSTVHSQHAANAGAFGSKSADQAAHNAVCGFFPQESQGVVHPGALYSGTCAPTVTPEVKSSAGSPVPRGNITAAVERDHSSLMYRVEELTYERDALKQENKELRQELGEALFERDLMLKTFLGNHSLTGRKLRLSAREDQEETDEENRDEMELPNSHNHNNNNDNDNNNDNNNNDDNNDNDNNNDNNDSDNDNDNDNDNSCNDNDNNDNDYDNDNNNDNNSDDDIDNDDNNNKDNDNNNNMGGTCTVVSPDERSVVFCAPSSPEQTSGCGLAQPESDGHSSNASTSSTAEPRSDCTARVHSEGNKREVPDSWRESEAEDNVVINRETYSSMKGSSSNKEGQEETRAVPNTKSMSSATPRTTDIAADAEHSCCDESDLSTTTDGDEATLLSHRQNTGHKNPSDDVATISFQEYQDNVSEVGDEYSYIGIYRSTENMTQSLDSIASPVLGEDSASHDIGPVGTGNLRSSDTSVDDLPVTSNDSCNSRVPYHVEGAHPNSRVPYRVQGARPKTTMPRYSAASRDAADGGDLILSGGRGLSSSFLARHSADASLPYLYPGEEGLSYHTNNLLWDRGASKHPRSPHNPNHLGRKRGRQVNGSSAGHSTQMYPAPEVMGRSHLASHTSQGYRSFSSHWQPTDPLPFLQELPSTSNQNVGFTAHQQTSTEIPTSSVEEIPVSAAESNTRLSHLAGSMIMDQSTLPYIRSASCWLNTDNEATGLSMRESVVEGDSFGPWPPGAVNIKDIHRGADHESLSNGSAISYADNPTYSLETKIDQACTLLERIVRENDERELTSRSLARVREQRKLQEAKERIAREREEREQRRLEEEQAQTNDHVQSAGKAGLPGPVQESMWSMCKHYERHCKVLFPCCGVFYPCHRCHNSSGNCFGDDVKALQATHLQCVVCKNEQEITKDSQNCNSCGTKLSQYFCPLCKHFTGVEKKPYHCSKCGICRIHEDRSFHCSVCNICLDKRLEGKHKCRPNSGHDECCICLEDAFSGCQILPCSHKVHRDCAIAMIQNGVHSCPVCRHPLHRTSSNSDN